MSRLIIRSEKDLSGIIEDIVSEYVEWLLQEVQGRWDGFLKRADRLIIAGGGAYYVKEFLRLSGLSFAYALLVGAMGCGIISHQSLNTGAEVTDEQLTKIKPGMDKDEVLIIHGEPTRAKKLSDGKKVWLYCWQGPSHGKKITEAKKSRSGKLPIWASSSSTKS